MGGPTEDCESEATMAGEREDIMQMMLGDEADSGHQLNQRDVSFGGEEDSGELPRDSID
jgi:hypothetical protein